MLITNLLVNIGGLLRLEHSLWDNTEGTPSFFEKKGARIDLCLVSNEHRWDALSLI